HKSVAKLIPTLESKGFRIEIESGVSSAEMEEAQRAGTVRESALVCPNPGCGQSTLIRAIRGDRLGSNALRHWDKSDVIPRPDDTFQERLYCIRWARQQARENGRDRVAYVFREPSEADLQREKTVLALLSERFNRWQDAGVIPSRRIEPGEETARLR